MNEVYLGDGLYASIEGGMVKLRAPRIEGDHEVFLELPVLENFFDFLVASNVIKEKPAHG